MKHPHLAAALMAVFVGRLFSQTGPAPSFRFLRENQDAPKDKRIQADLKKWTVQLSPVQTAAFTPILMPCQYFCGWIESKNLAAKK